MRKSFKQTKRITICFIIIILFFTMFSKTITYILMPKVTAKLCSSSTITQKKEYDSFNKIYMKEEQIRIPVKLEIPLYIDKIHVCENQTIKKGDKLISFKKEECQQLKNDMKEKMEEINKKINNIAENKKNILQNYKIQLESIDERLAILKSNPEDIWEYKVIREEIKNDNIKVQKQTEQLEVNQQLYEIGAIPKKELIETKEQLKVLQDEALQEEEKYEYDLKKEIASLIQRKQEVAIQQDKEVNLIENVDVYYKTLETLKNNYEKLLPIFENYQVEAPFDGIITNISIKESTTYQGQDIIAAIAPIESEYIYSVDISEEQKEIWEEYTTATYLLSNKSYVPSIIGTDGKKGLFKLEEPLDEGIDIDEGYLRLEKESERYSVVVPRQAVVDNKVYTLDEKEGIWGKEYYVNEVEVVTGENDSLNIGIISGLDLEKQVVLTCDRKLIDGQRVMIELP
ncbi:MAG: hypothetical protein AB9856_13930 [Cellulosilyticaceae bacterium]